LLFSSLVVLVCPGPLKETEARPKSVSPSASPSSSDSSSSSSTRHKKKSKKSKHDKKEAKKAAKHDKKEAKKAAKHDRKRKHEETPAEVKLRIKIEKAEEDANKKVCIARTKSAEQVLGKLSPNIASIAGTIDKPAMEHIPVLVKCPMNDALAELKTIEDNAANIVHSQGASNIELPDMKVTVCR
jgi:flagellum-specific peptidoglycan hydrolase FlgJ